VITGALRRAVPPEWRIFIETNIRATGLLRGLPRRRVERESALSPQDMERIGNLRPDAVAVNHELKKIAILDLTRPYDGRDRDANGHPIATPLRTGVNDEAGSGNEESPDHDDTEPSGDPHVEGRRSMIMAAERKQESYKELADVLRQIYGRTEWRIEVLPWVVGVRGVVDAAGIHRAMAFLDIPQQRRSSFVRKTALASVQAFEFLHRVRHSSNPWAIPVVEAMRMGERGLGKRRRKGGSSAVSIWQRWKQLSGDSMRLRLQQSTWRGAWAPKS